jgi:DNA-binding transcriptional LysR family regulator
MELRHLHYFVAVAEERHFGRAAERLNISQPPLSQQIRCLERELGVQLFIRGRPVELTQAGWVFLEEARRTVAAAEHAFNVAQQAGPGGAMTQIRLGYPASAIFELVPRSLRAFREQYPDVEVQVAVGHTMRHLEALHARQVDLAFLGFGLGADVEGVGGVVRFRVLHRESLLVAIPEDHPLACASGVQLEQLTGEPIILFPRTLDPSLHDYLVNDVLSRSRTSPPPMTLEATSLESTYSTIAARLGVAFIAESTARIVTTPGIVHRRLVPNPPVLELGVAWRRDAASRVVKSFLAVIDGALRYGLSHR